jgi:hypothetical protein
VHGYREAEIQHPVLHVPVACPVQPNWLKVPMSSPITGLAKAGVPVALPKQLPKLAEKLGQYATCCHPAALGSRVRHADGGERHGYRGGGSQSHRKADPDRPS